MMTDDPDIDRLLKIINEGWEDEPTRLVRLTEGQHVTVSENMMVKLQMQIGFDTYVVMEVSEHITLLEDGATIIEAHGRMLM